ncbi:hypothetical protein Aau02nite_26010 [Amorphoplanes auranticolor]|uniref:Uncharacterized protein n=1 Tax=Actinoplanes auranticolor TaxID=47988 RepID=A0A919SB09_9ACTN|nr:hypothetical protein Aau02nite_26010 [Actinoplanes auranticolor]
MLLASRASHRLRKAATRNGAHADGGAARTVEDWALTVPVYPGVPPSTAARESGAGHDGVTGLGSCTRRAF